MEEKLPCTWPISSDEALTLTESVRLLESYGIKPSLAGNGTGFLRQVATVIARLEINPFKCLDMSSLKSGDIVVIQGDDLADADVKRMKEGIKSLAEPNDKRKIGVVAIDSGTDIYTVTGEDRERLAKWLLEQPS